MTLTRSLLLVLLCRAAPCAGQDEVAPTTAPATAPADAEDSEVAAPAPPPVEKLPPLPADAIVPRLSFSNPFNQYEGGIIPGWQYGGDATLANDYISLTPSQPNRVGWIWSEESVSSMDAWEVSLEFHIGGSQERGAGGGMAFWYTSQQGRTGPIYGHEDSYEGLGIFFDTYEGEADGPGQTLGRGPRNSQPRNLVHPRAQAMIPTTRSRLWSR